MPLIAKPPAVATSFATDEMIACYCPYCPTTANLLLICKNAWSQISNSYFLNVIERDNLQDAQGIKSADNRLGSGQLEGCQLETLRCKRCTHLVGTRCLEAPPDKKEFQGCYLLKLKFFILKSASTGDRVEPYIIADTPSATPGSTSRSTQNSAQQRHLEPSGPTAPVSHGLASRPASTIPSGVPSSKTLSNDPSSGTTSHQVGGLLREQLSGLSGIDELSNTVQKLQAEAFNLRQAMMDIQRSQQRMPSQAIVESQANEIRSLRHDLQSLRDRVTFLEKLDKAKSTSSQPSTLQDASFVNGRKRSFEQSNGISTDPSPSWNNQSINPQGPNALSEDQNIRMNDVRADDISTLGDNDDIDNGNAATSELASRQMIPSSIMETNGDFAGETVVIGATNTGTNLEELGPGEANEGGGMVIYRSTPTTAFARPSLPLKSKPAAFERFGESQTSEYVPSGISSESAASLDIRPASFVPLNRHNAYNATGERKFDSLAVIEGWDNSQDPDYRPSGEVSTDAFRGTPEGARSRWRGRGRGSGGGSCGDREAVKFKNYSARLDEPAPWESEDWDGTTGMTALIRSPSSRGRTVRQRGSSSTNRTLNFDTPTGAYKRSKLGLDGKPDRPRDEAGRILRPNGQIDGRSLRYHRKKTVPNVPNNASPVTAENVPNDASPATPASHHTAAPTTDSPKTHEDFMKRIYPNGRPIEKVVDDNVALR